MATFIDEDNASSQLSQFKDEFTSKIAELKDKPVKDRGYNDIFCCIFFLVFLGAFIGYSAYSINTMSYQLSVFEDIRSPSGTIMEGITLDKLKILAIVIFSCLGGAILVSLLLCGILCVIPNYGIWIMSLTGSIVILALAIYFAASNIGINDIK